MTSFHRASHLGPQTDAQRMSAVLIDTMRCVVALGVTRHDKTKTHLVFQWILTTTTRQRQQRRNSPHTVSGTQYKTPHTTQHTQRTHHTHQTHHTTDNTTRNTQHSHTLTLSCTLMHSHALTYSHILSHTLTYSHRLSQTLTDSHTLSHTLTLALSLSTPNDLISKMK